MGVPKRYNLLKPKGTIKVKIRYNKKTSRSWFFVYRYERSLFKVSVIRHRVIRYITHAG